MLLETTKFHHRDVEFSYFEYRAKNPVVVNRPITIYGTWSNNSQVNMWTVDGEGVVGMTGSIFTTGQH